MCTLFTGSRVIGFHFPWENLNSRSFVCSDHRCPGWLNTTLNLINHRRTIRGKIRQLIKTVSSFADSSFAGCLLLGTKKNERSISTSTSTAVLDSGKEVSAGAT